MSVLLKTAFALTLLAALACAAPAHAAFPGDNGKILFVRSDVNYGNYALHLMNPDGSGIEPVYASGLGPFVSTTDPLWSPDGTRIVYGGYRDGWRIFVFSPRGDLVANIGPPFGFVDNPSWSPDGAQIVYEYVDYASCDEYGYYCPGGIRKVNLDGTGDTLIAPFGRDPAWSPDGTKIAFLGSGAGYGDDIWVMNADGSDPRNVMRPNLEPDRDPNWSPDGTKIAFTRTVGADLFSGLSNDVFVMNADGGSATNVSNRTGPDGNASWSPDGTSIVWSSQGSLLVKRFGGATRTLTMTGHDGAPDWQAIPQNADPDCSGVTANPSSLWPPNHNFQTVELAGATDPDGDAIAIAIDGVTQDERVGHRPDARAGDSADEVELRAQRRPRGDGRVYHIVFTASDGNGGECSGEATVEVRRKNKQSTVDSAPPSYDSFG